jgi:GDP-D-mannose dehydratase
MAKTALITGVTGQDGAYLARLLVNKGYKVFLRVADPLGRGHGPRRRPHPGGAAQQPGAGALLSGLHPGLYGNARISPQVEQTPFHPRCPYAIAKLYAHHITVNYREALGLHTRCGILFNHERLCGPASSSPAR